MIHTVTPEGRESHYVISSRGTWLPGAYETKRAANYAFRFAEQDLLLLQLEKNQTERGIITFEDLQELRKKLKGKEQ